ncbi:calpain clp-1-like, partial [Saccoglossus kowalevskii]|uniref:Calpain clp-1-like n=1 Tax=Saccoglossus kowalevskii TaxID=10224 RepID=A0ABM0LVL3_SACKO
MGCSGSTSGGKLAADKDTTDTWRSDEVPPGKEQPVDNPDRAEPYGDDDLALGVAVNWKEIADEVLKKGELYEDDEFPAIENSLFFSDESADGIVWKRPKEISDSPSLLVDGISRDDVVQGILGDCWFLSSCASIAQHKRFMEKVVPTDQYLWSSGKYCGLFHFRFWRFGKWVDVIIDDRIPVRRDQVIFAKSSNSKEFWVSLLEKAYAKLHGSYEGLAGGQASDALIDMTGGLTERCDLKEPRAGLFRQLLRNFKYGSFLTCNKKGDWRAADEADEHGLVSGHAYTVTSVRRVQTRHGDYVNLLRVRNPWGNATEWNGNWSDESATWDLVSDEVKGQLELKDKDDGEF